MSLKINIIIKKLKKFLISFIPKFILNILKNKKEEIDLKIWLKNGCLPPTPHLIKQNTIREYQKKSGYSILVETGTYLGDMVDAQKEIFEKIISVELGFELFEKAKKRFKKFKNITIVHGDSGKVLPEILKEYVDGPAIFWLDGHYSEGITSKGEKECPIYEELTAIFNSKKFNHIILIDDARYFNGNGDFPTIEFLIEFVKAKNEKYNFEIKNDIVQFVI